MGYEEQIKWIKRNWNSLGPQDCDHLRTVVPFYITDNTGREWLARTVCSFPWCGACEYTKNYRLTKKIGEHVAYWNTQQNLQWQFVTMSTINNNLLTSSFNLEAKAWSRFRVAHNDAMIAGRSHPWDQVATWVGWREVTYSNEKGFNVHRHCLVAIPKGKSWSWIAMHERWDKACGLKGHFDSSVIKGDMNLGYILKYISKKKYWGGLSKLEAYRYCLGLFRRPRIIRSLGSKPPGHPPSSELEPPSRPSGRKPIQTVEQAPIRPELEGQQIRLDRWINSESAKMRRIS